MDWQKRDETFNKMKSRKGYASKVAAKCFDCIYDPENDGNWRQQVTACSVVTCALYEVRPKSKPEPK